MREAFVRVAVFGGRAIRAMVVSRDGFFDANWRAVRRLLAWRDLVIDKERRLGRDLSQSPMKQ